MIQKLLFTPIDNIQLILFRIFFGFLMVAECWGAIATGWVNETFVEPQYTFAFMGFEWTQGLVGSFTSIMLLGEEVSLGYMHLYFALMGSMGVLIMLGWRYRLASFAFALMWSLAYFMQKSHYNNHYYLVMLISWFMAVVPAHRDLSIDARNRLVLRSELMHSWIRILMIGQMAVVYFYAAVAKLYPGWWSGRYLKLRLSSSAHWFKNELGWDSFASVLSSDTFAVALSWLGMGFDFLIVPLLLYKKTRKLAFVGALIFHLFNSITLHIGIFPYFALACCVFFFEPELLRKLFRLKERAFSTAIEGPLLKMRTLIVAMMALYFVIQVFLPLRHWLIADDVLWTEEGHRLSWRMMLRTKRARTTFYIVDNESGKKERIELSEHLTPLQMSRVCSKPDMMWQFAQKLKKKYAMDSQDAIVNVRAYLSINGGPYQDYIDDKVNLAAVRWKYIGHQNWIRPSPPDYYKREIAK